MTKPFIYQENHISVLTAQSREKTKLLKFLTAFQSSGTTSAGRKTELLPCAPMQRHCVFKSDGNKGTYNHHSGICKWNGTYYYCFSNGTVDEDGPGQSTMLSRSDDGMNWSELVCIAVGDADEDIFVRTCGIMPYGDKLVVFIRRNWNTKAALAPGMSVHDDKVIECRIDAHVSEDGRQWRIVENIVPQHWAFEEPRLTTQDRLLTPGTDHRTSVPTVLLWPGDNPLENPQVIHIPFYSEDMTGEKEYANPRDGHFPYGEASWYQDDDDRIWMYMRDESGTGRLFISLSEDGGETWTEPMISDMPDSMARVYAGRLNDGRYFIVGNAVGQILDRSKLIISLSENGATFDKMYILVDDPTEQAHDGMLKVNGYQYPNCLVDGDKLLIAYSVNKEDMECGILDMTSL